MAYEAQSPHITYRAKNLLEAAMNSGETSAYIIADVLDQIAADPDEAGVTQLRDRAIDLAMAAEALALQLDGAAPLVMEPVGVPAKAIKAGACFIQELLTGRPKAELAAVVRQLPDATLAPTAAALLRQHYLNETRRKHE